MLSVSRILLVLVTAFALPAVASAQGKRLYDFEGAPFAPAAESKTSVASVREARIAFSDSLSALAASGSLELSDFGGRSFTAERTSVETRALDDRTWRGKIRLAKFDGDVILTLYKDRVAGLIYMPSGVFEIVPRGDTHILVQLDQSQFPECGGEVRSETLEVPVAAPLGAADSGDRIDVLVVYTTATKNFLGGDAQARALAQQAIDATNTAYINSRIRQRVRMVHSEEFVYTESGNSSTDLSNLRSNAGIAALRNTHNADLVAEISEVTGVCGIGYLMGNPTTGNQNNAFTVTARSCAVGNLSFAHELGHNMGSQHNPENGSNPSYPYGFGHYVNGVYRTVMSYVDPCTSGCTRRPYFSNPGVIYLGHPTGVENARDNARSINNTADVIANYRYSGRSLMMTDFNGGDLFIRRILQNARPVAWQSHNMTGNVKIELSRDEGMTWETVIADTANDGSQHLIINGPMTKRARLRVSSIDFPWVTDSSVRNITLR